MADQTTRDFRQRSLGCVGASMLAHVGLLVLLVLAPQSEALQPIGTPEGLAPGAVTVELEMPATGTSEPAAATAAPETQPSEVLLASNDDPNAVPLPSKNVEQVKPKAIAAPVIKEVAKPKVVKAAAPKAPAKPKITSPDGDVEIEKAISAARVEEPKVQAIAQSDETVSPTTSEPELPTTPEEEDQEVETAKAQIAEAAIASAPLAETAPAPEAAPSAPMQESVPEVSKPLPLVQKPAAPQAAPQQPAAIAAAPVAPKQMATAPPQAIPAQVSQQGSGGASAQPGTAAAQPGTAAPGRSVRAGGLGYAVPMGTRIRDASELVARPGNPSPVYPQQDRLLGRQGLAVVVGRITNDGSIISVQLERSSGSASMDQEALKTFAKWKFMSGQQGLVRKPFQFVLSGAAKELPARLRY